LNVDGLVVASRLAVKFVLATVVLVSHSIEWTIRRRRRRQNRCLAAVLVVF